MILLCNWMYSLLDCFSVLSFALLFQLFTSTNDPFSLSELGGSVDIEIQVAELYEEYRGSISEIRLLFRAQVSNVDAQT